MKKPLIALAALVSFTLLAASAEAAIVKGHKPPVCPPRKACPL
jgi:hypothetical protein